MNNRPFDNQDNDSEIERQAHARRVHSEGDSGTQQTPPNPFWSNPVVRIALFLISCLSISYLGREAVNVTYAAMRMYPFSQEPFNPLYWLVFLPLIGAMAALAALWLMKRREKGSLWKSTGFGSQGAGRAILIGLSSSAVVCALNLVIAAITNNRYPATAVMPHLFPLLLAYSLFATLCRVVTNETVFHGFVLQELEKRWGTLAALVVSSIFFCLYTHAYQLYPVFYHNYSPPELAALLSSMFWSLVSATLLASAYLYTRNLWAPIAYAIASWFFLSGTTLLFHYSQNLTVMYCGEIIVAAWFLVMTVRNGQWKPGPGPREIVGAAYANVVKLVEMTDPGKQKEPVESGNT